MPKARYRTWLRPGRLFPIVGPAALSLAGCALAVLSWWFLLFLIPLAVFGAEAEGVGDRVTFERQNAAALAYPDGTFDVVVSCMTFHEIKDNKSPPERARPRRAGRRHQGRP
ncbi:hypothetical protein GCM10010172_79460 [Paractinoplanes ferrugineus]|uniref:Methyltransferase type 11 domain-containing protein n=1 Tax=Paractinoplanes ferrugineus TaxID=113564 RepID=A0A919MHV1_9ACTN|nr:class I SAM-dependent methyltransferase [Actinoplanes ferrugineus]GIE13020.1 hypothetical protein Afe05nite_48600 [Actinoplanes ferrugineus]